MARVSILEMIQDNRYCSLCYEMKLWLFDCFLLILQEAFEIVLSWHVYLTYISTLYDLVTLTVVTSRYSCMVITFKKHVDENNVFDTSALVKPKHFAPLSRCVLSSSVVWYVNRKLVQQNWMQGWFSFICYKKGNQFCWMVLHQSFTTRFPNPL